VVEAEQKDIIFYHLTVNTTVVGSVPQDTFQTKTFEDLWSGILLPMGFPNECRQRLSVNIRITNRPAIKSR